MKTTIIGARGEGLAVLLALPAACHSQPQATANAQPPAKAVAAPPRNDLEVAEDAVRHQMDNGQAATFANAMAYRDDRIAIVCGEVTRNGHRERYIAVDGRGAWLESEMRPGEMDRAVRENCHAGAQAPQGEGVMNAIIGGLLAILAIFVLIKVTLWIFKVIAILILIGALVFGYFWLKNRMDGGRR